MLIKSLRIRKSTNNEIIREVSFTSGANLVVDTEGSERHNKVGKTTFLQLIDLLLGARDRKFIYTDQETENVNEDLRKLIEDNRVVAEMTLADTLDKPAAKTVELKIELFSRGSQYINGEKTAINDYRIRLNELLFNNKENVPTFRQLINSFVRVSVGGDDDAFLKTLTRSSTATYRGLYNFLFDISNPNLDKELSTLNTEKNHVEEAVRQYKRVNRVNEIEEQRQILVALNREHAATKQKADDILDSETYKRNRDRIASARQAYAQATDEMSRVEYQLRQAESSLQAAKQEMDREPNLELSRQFFDEICSMIPDINKYSGPMILDN